MIQRRFGLPLDGDIATSMIAVASCSQWRGERLRVVAARAAVALAASALVLTALVAGTASAAVGIVLDKTTLKVGEVLVVRVPGGVPSGPHRPSMAIVLSRSADPRQFGSWPRPAVLRAGALRLRVAYGPWKLYPRKGSAPLDLAFLGFVRFDRRENAMLLRVRVRLLTRGSYVTFLYCPRCGSSLIPGPRLRIR